MIVGTFLGVAAIGCIYILMMPSWKSVAVLLMFLAPLAALSWLVWIVMTTANPNPSVGQIALPFVLAGADIVILWMWLYSKDPKATSEITTAAAWTYIGANAARSYQHRRDKERAKAVADELERRQRMER